MSTGNSWQLYALSSMKRRVVRQCAFDETRKIVYHSHCTTVFNSGGTNYPQGPRNIVSYLVRRGDDRAALHRRGSVLAPDHDFDVPHRIDANTFVQDFHQARLFFEGLKQFAHLLRTGKLRFGEDVERAVQVYCACS